MKIRLYITILLLSLFGVACNPLAESDDMDNNKLTTRISFYPAAVEFNSVGVTPEEEVGTSVIVTVNPSKHSSLAWVASSDKEWCTVTTTTSNIGGLTERALKITVDENVAYKRIANITVKASDGTESILKVTQTGVFADAAITVDKEKIEFNADEIVPADVTFTTNMGDVYAVSKDDGADWISWEDLGNNTIRFTATQWDDKENARKANVYITIGTEATSLAVATIPVTQLALDVYCYIWGASVADYPSLDKSTRMKKVSEGVYTFDTYFVNAATNAIRINTSQNDDVYPAYALAQDGKLKRLNSAADALPVAPAIDIDGRRTLMIDLNALTYTLTRISTTNCMTDQAAALCKTKAYKAKDGSMKVWMTSNLNWNGGDDIGSMKLGSRIVTSKLTGGYSADLDTSYSGRDSAFDEQESGGSVVGDATLTEKYGRYYAINEFLLGVPNGALSIGKTSVQWPTAYNEGSTFVDAIGTSITAKPYNKATMAAATDDDAFFKANPALSAQIQGICPYGWHIANFKDWYDLAYAVYDAAKDDATYPVSLSNVTINKLVNSTANNIAPWLRTQEGWATSPVRAAGADSFGFDLYPGGWRLFASGYDQHDAKAHCWIPLMGSTSKKVWRVMNITYNSNYYFADSLDAGNAAVPIRCVKNYK